MAPVILSNISSSGTLGSHQIWFAFPHNNILWLKSFMLKLLQIERYRTKINLVIKCYIFYYITFLEQYYNSQYFSFNFSMTVYKKFPDFSRIVQNIPWFLQILSPFPWLLQYCSPFSSFPGFLTKFSDLSRKVRTLSTSPTGWSRWWRT